MIQDPGKNYPFLPAAGTRSRNFSVIRQNKNYSPSHCFCDGSNWTFVLSESHSRSSVWGEDSKNSFSEMFIGFWGASLPKAKVTLNFLSHFSWLLSVSDKAQMPMKRCCKRHVCAGICVQFCASWACHLQSWQLLSALWTEVAPQLSHHRFGYLDSSHVLQQRWITALFHSSLGKQFL